MPALPRSLPRICVVLGFPTAAELSRAAQREYKDGNLLLEFRLDYLRDPSSGLQVLRSLRRSYPDAQVIATCRHKQNHGHFNGTLENQLAILRDAGKAGAVALDLEIESAEPGQSCLPALRDAAPLIVSYHNFQNTPALSPLLRKLTRIEADAYKIATTARKPSDNMRLIDFARRHTGPHLVFLAMSEIGTPSRVLAPSIGSLYTYASPVDFSGTASGQISSKLMRSLYRCDKITANTRIYGVIADPVAHSKSPSIHNRAFQARRIDAVYLPFLVPSACLADWMKTAKDLPVAGFSVTIPHKQKIMRYLDAIEPLAKRIGAVNTVWRKGGKWRGTNTDTEGVLKPLSRELRIAGSSILIAGYGGAARAAAIALADAGATVTITGRNVRSAEALARVVRGEAVSIKAAQEQRYDALINATPLGMSPKPDGCVFDDVIPAQVVLDMVYNPHETLLLKRAKDQGLKVIYGAEMLVEQAACQFEIWTGDSAPRAVMQSALDVPLNTI